MADKSWMKPGAECWVWSFWAPKRAVLLGVQDDGETWGYRFLAPDGSVILDGDSHRDYIERTELEACREWLGDNLDDLGVLVTRICETRARIARLEANDG